MQELEEYAENTATSLIYLQLEAMGFRDIAIDHVASHVGRAVGIVTILRGVPFLAKERRFYLPADLSAKVSITLYIYYFFLFFF